MFSRKHYKKVASEVKFFLSCEGVIQPCDVVHMLSNMFKQDNPSFDERRFIAACGMTWEDYAQE